MFSIFRKRIHGFDALFEVRILHGFHMHLKIVSEQEDTLVVLTPAEKRLWHKLQHVCFAKMHTCHQQDLVRTTLLVP